VFESEEIVLSISERMVPALQCQKLEHM